MASDAAPNQSVFVETILSNSALDPQHVALRYEGESTTYEALTSSVYRFAHALESRGVGQGSLVGILAPHTPDAVISRYASIMLGACTSFLPILEDLMVNETMLRALQPDYLLAFPETAHLIPASSVLPTGAKVLSVRSSSAEASSNDGAEELDWRIYPDDHITFRGSLDALGVHVSTAGSTGVPKPTVRTFRQWTEFTIRAKDQKPKITLINGTLCSIGQAQLDGCLYSGGTAVMQERRDDPHYTLETIKKEGVNQASLSQTRLFAMMDIPEAKDLDLSSLTFACGGEVSPLTLRRRAAERLGLNLRFGYGITELGFLGGAPCSPEFGYGAKLRFLPGVSVRARDFTGEVISDPSRVGRLEFIAPYVMRHYHGQESAPKDAKEWHATSDMGYINADGSVEILGREDDVVRVSGNEKDLKPNDVLAGIHIAETLCRNQEVVKYAVVIRDVEKGRWVAGVQPWPGKRKPLDLDNLERQALSSHPIDKISFVELGERVPQSTGGKVNRVKVIEMAN